MNGKKIVPQVAGSAIAAVGVWAAGEFAKVSIPPEVAVAIGTIVSIIVSALTPDSMESE